MKNSVYFGCIQGHPFFIVSFKQNMILLKKINQSLVFEFVCVGMIE